MNLVGLLITILVAVLVFWILAALTTTIVGVVGAILVLLAGIPSGGFGLGNRRAV
jgi:Na+/H+ antiporter NhaD/arsenite permease-like protein